MICEVSSVPFVHCIVAELWGFFCFAERMKHTSYANGGCLPNSESLDGFSLSNDMCLAGPHSVDNVWLFCVCFPWKITPFTYLSVPSKINIRIEEITVLDYLLQWPSTGYLKGEWGARGGFCPLGTFGNIWIHFCLSVLRVGCYWRLMGVPEMLLNIL